MRFDSDDEQSEDEEDEDTGGLRLEDEAEDDKGQTSRAIHYVSGDVTQPVKTKTSVNLIVHCAGTGNLKNEGRASQANNISGDWIGGSNIGSFKFGMTLKLTKHTSSISVNMLAL